MISSIDIQITKIDLLLYGTVLIISNIIINQLNKINIFNKTSTTLTIATLLGVALHRLFTNKISYILNNSLKIKNYNIKHFVYNLIKFGTIFITQNIVVSYFDNTGIVFDKLWFINSILTIIIYTIFNICESLLPNVGEYQQLFNDLIIVSSSSLIVSYFIYNNINNENLIESGALIVGLVVFHLIVKKFIIPKKKTKVVGSFTTIPDFNKLHNNN